MDKIIFLLCAFLAGVVFADVSPNQVKEVKHLLDFVRDSNCIISRNGTKHSAEKGAAHIEKKYKYFRDNIKNTEDFIKYSATKSTISGDYYIAVCPGNKTIRTQEWLLDELQRFRNKPETKITVCTEPRPQICTMEYVPVCALHKNNNKKPYSSGCSACSNANVVSYTPDACT